MVFQHLLLPLQHLETHEGRAIVTRYANQIVHLRPAAVADSILWGVPNGGYRDGEPCERGRGVAPHQIHIVELAGRPYTVVELLQILHAKTLRNAYRHRYLGRSAIHGVDIAHVHRHSLISQVA